MRKEKFQIIEFNPIQFKFRLKLSKMYDKTFLEVQNQVVFQHSLIWYIKVIF